MKYTFIYTTTKTKNNVATTAVTIKDNAGNTTPLDIFITTLFPTTNGSWEQTIPPGMNPFNFTGEIPLIHILATCDNLNTQIDTFFKMCLNYYRDLSFSHTFTLNADFSI